MNKNIDFKKIWNRREIEVPEIKDLYNKAKKFKRNSLNAVIIANILLLTVLLFIGIIWYYYQPELITTKIGIILSILAIIVYLIPYNKMMFPLILKNDIGVNSQEYLHQLIKLKEKQIFQQTTILSIYFLFLSIGLGFYLFEFVSKMTSVWGIITYSVIILWIAICWLYLRPKAIEKQNAKLNKLLLKFHDMKNQILN